MMRVLWVVVFMVVAGSVQAQQRMVEAYSPQTGVPTEAWSNVPAPPTSGPTYTTREMRQVFDPATGVPREAWVDVVKPVPGYSPRPRRAATPAAPAPYTVTPVQPPTEYQAEYQGYTSTEYVPRYRARAPAPPAAESYSGAEHLERLQRLAVIAAQMYPNGVPTTESQPQPTPAGPPPLLIDGSNFDPMAMRSNQIAYEATNGARDECQRRWSESVASIPDNVSFSRRERIVALYAQDRAGCIAEARAAQ